MGKNNPLICAMVWICVGVAVLRMSKRQSDWRHGKVPKWLTHVWEVWGGGKNGCHVGLERPRRVGGGEVATWLAGQGRQTDGRRQTETKRLTDWVSFWVEHTKPKSSEDSTQIFCQITFQQPFAVTVSLSLRVGSLFKILFSRGSPQMLVFVQGLDNQLLYQRVSKIKL